MIRAKRVFIRASQIQIDRPFACNRESAVVWNECLALSKVYHQNHRKWISKGELQTQTKRRFHLHSQSIQAVTHKYVFAREATRQSIKQGIKTAKYPHRKKEHFNTKWVKDGFKIYPSGKIELSMSIYGGKVHVELFLVIAMFYTLLFFKRCQ